jgi:hypothetical protein
MKILDPPLNLARERSFTPSIRIAESAKLITGKSDGGKRYITYIMLHHISCYARRKPLPE